MKQCIIVGARGFGREMFARRMDLLGFGSEFVFKGFLDSKREALDGFSGYPPILGTCESYEIQPDDVFFCAMGEPKWRKKYAELIEEKGGQFITLKHISSRCYQTVSEGGGCVFDAFTEGTCDVKLGRHVCLFHAAAVGHDAVIGDYAHLAAHVGAAGGVVLGEGVMVHPGAHIIPHKCVGDWAVIGGGSLVIQDVPARKTVIGVPAKIFEF
ncbi:MAG: sialic acid O-acetyltransferase [Kiritimatiellia bacterium]